MSSYFFSENLNKLIIKQGRDIVLIDLSEIMFLEKEKGMSNIFVVTKNNTFKIRANIDEFEKLLKNKHFLRCHKSFIVNLQHVFKISEQGNNSYKINFKKNNKTIPATAKQIKYLRFLFQYR